ncbi:hypothetical protein HY844_00230, partial [Candidatus Berkelbacteria bacterium]|nr:hypothetical protein [Candidatus Berkelbacteria bacterium]
MQLISQTNEFYVIDKPPFMAVEPPSHQSTLRDWMIENGYIKPTDWKDSERFGVVHRIDADTSGIVIWAKNPMTQARLKLLWQGRAIKKTYTALLIGECQKEGVIELPIMRDNKNDKQKVSFLNEPNARAAITEYKKLKVCQIENI